MRAAVALLSAFAFATAQAQEKPKRLSNWLLEQPSARDPYPAGLSWHVQGEEPAQRELRDQVATDLERTPSLRALADWIRTLPVTGRVSVTNADARWLIVHPNRDPVQAPGAWIWAPPRESGISEKLSHQLAAFLATQGPGPDQSGAMIDLPPTAASAFSQRSRSAAALANDWGETGLLQTPTARMPRA